VNTGENLRSAVSSAPLTASIFATFVLELKFENGSWMITEEESAAIGFNAGL
jgi:hypothetical protein